MTQTTVTTPITCDALANLRFDNRLRNQLPGDGITDNYRRQIQGALHSDVTPVTTPAPHLIGWSREVAAELGLSDADCQHADFVSVFSGNVSLSGMHPHATCYGGHQFGNWAGQLGDGRAINLGEACIGERDRLTLQLKGAGPTPYSRTADGLAVLRSSVREFLCSEAMYHLGVPTTRALSLIGTGNQVMRDMLYDGNAAPEPGAVVCRVAPSFTRFGHFEMLNARGETDLLRDFAHFTIRNDFPEMNAPDSAEALDRELVLQWFAEVSERTRKMIVHWMRVGFVHGVMNTDNMSILGLTIDYGPYGWLEDFDPDWTPNTTDAAQRRYRYGQQPAIAQWNLLQLANAIYPLVDEAAPLEEILGQFGPAFTQDNLAMWLQKMGLEAGKQEQDIALVQNLHSALRATETDMTLFFRYLADVDPTAPKQENLEQLQRSWYLQDEQNPDTTAATAELSGWLDTYVDRLSQQNLPAEQRKQNMNAVNPLYVMRNYLAQLAIDKAEQGDFSEVQTLLDVMRKPYEAQPGRDAYAEKRPDWARTRVGCSMLSCSS